MQRLADFKGAKVLIMGLGLHGGGVGTAEFFSRLGSRVMITDLKSCRELASSITKLKRWHNVAYHLGGHRPRDFKTADYVIKGPGVPETSKFLKIAKRAGVPILSDVEVFFGACPAPVVGVTGTKGKSTTATLIARMLTAGVGVIYARSRLYYTKGKPWQRVWLGGNIRKSMLEFLPRVGKNDLVVLELSSFQLDSLKNSRRGPTIALITNVFPDHLNRYPSMAAYAASKANIFRFQRPTDCLFLNRRDRFLARLARNTPGRVVRFDPQRITRRFSTSLPSALPPYYFPNVAAAVAVAQYLGMGESTIRKVLKNFRGLGGRMEFVRNIGGVAFINDTTATNPRSAKEAVIATKRRIGAKRLYVIAGGYDKGLPVGEFTNALIRHTAAVVWLPGTATNKMKSKIKNQKSKIPMCFDAKTMNDAVRIAGKNAKPDDVVLLSPGAASFGLFKHEFDRGEQFVKAVKRLHP